MKAFINGFRRNLFYIYSFAAGAPRRVQAIVQAGKVKYLRALELAIRANSGGVVDKTAESVFLNEYLTVTAIPDAPEIGARYRIVNWVLNPLGRILSTANPLNVRIDSDFEDENTVEANFQEEVFLKGEVGGTKAGTINNANKFVDIDENTGNILATVQNPPGQTHRFVRFERVEYDRVFREVTETVEEVITLPTPTVSGTLHIIGTARVGSELFADTSDIVCDRTDHPVGGVSFQWMRSDNGDDEWTAIEDATSRRYTLTSDDLSKYLTCNIMNVQFHVIDTPHLICEITEPVLNTLRTITVNGGTCDIAQAVAGDTITVTLTEPDEDKRFVNWVADGDEIEFGDENAESTTFIMPDRDVEINVELLQLYNVSVNNGISDGAWFASGETVTVSAEADPQDKRFSGWTSSPEVDFDDNTATTTTFTMPEEAVNITANQVQLYEVTVNSNGDNPTGGGWYAAGETVNITAGTAPLDEEDEPIPFYRWSSNPVGAAFTDAMSAITDFTMPDNAVTVTGIWKVIFGTWTDIRDGHEYVTILTPDDKEWLAENLLFNQTGSEYYDNDPNNGVLYGRLYNHDQAVAATVNLPDGWRLPTFEDYRELSLACGNGGYYNSMSMWVPNGTAGLNLKSTSGWDNQSGGSNGNGLDTHGFNGLPGGMKHFGASFMYKGMYGSWWTSDSINGTFYCWELSYNGDVFYPTGMDGSTYYSVRLVRDLT
jgi:uncharacterized protein (TIGR02145 family)